MKRLLRPPAIGMTLFVLVQGLTGCDGTRASPPTAPTAIARATPPAQPAPIRLAVFVDSPSNLSTSDVRDADEQLVQFNSAGELILPDLHSSFPEFFAVGNFIGYHHRNDVLFQIRFGTRNGERRAYLGWPGERLTIVDVSIDNQGQLRFVETGVTVPGS